MAPVYPPPTSISPARWTRNPRLGFWLRCLLLYVAITTLTRIVLAFWVVEDGATGALPGAFMLGLVDDVAMAVILGLPFLVGLHLCRWRWLRVPAHLLLIAMLGVALFTAIAELFFWQEFNSRFNGIAVYYLIFPKEVIGNIRESFDLRLYLPPIAVAAFLLYLPLRRPLDRALGAPGDWRMFLRGLAVALVAALVALPVAIYGPFEPAAERTVNEVAANGTHSLFRAFLTNDSHYDGVYAGLPEKIAVDIAHDFVREPNAMLLAAADEPSMRRMVTNAPRDKKLNVVLILEESFGSVYFEDVYEPKQKDYSHTISPNWHRLARNGLMFTNIYATGDRTVRALEAVLTSFPPIPGISTARRNGADGMHSLPALLKSFGYHTAFLYGGPTAFDNMGTFWQGIGYDEVMGQADIADQSFRTIWGVADEYLFKEGLRRLDAMAQGGEPFLFTMLTVSNHRPFLYPPGRVAQEAAPNQRDHAAAYADWALGQFVDAARAHPWFDNTVFVMIGDHGPKVWGAAQIPVQAFRVPLLFYAPKHIPAERNAVLGSSLDVTPTLLGLLGLSYESSFFGVDLRHVPADGGRIAIAHNFDVAVGDGQHVAVLTPKGDIRYYDMVVGAHQLRPAIRPLPELGRRAVGLTQTAHHMFYARQYHEDAGRPLSPPGESHALAAHR